MPAAGRHALIASAAATSNVIEKMRNMVVVELRVTGVSRDVSWDLATLMGIMAGRNERLATSARNGVRTGRQTL